jgi:hypothetical protein
VQTACSSAWWAFVLPCELHLFGHELAMAAPGRRQQQACTSPANARKCLKMAHAAPALFCSANIIRASRKERGVWLLCTLVFLGRDDPEDLSEQPSVGPGARYATVLNS